ncbi:DUF4132 domain-containing protein [Dactylosporangium sp. AC04546]|uniref:DUF4132 domain-containing protein n=1 Tax=Dactylosporangium sp. AC04546 TaxID=2862460 RepID=UPI001EDEC0C3|nr:DUF4132 domain-containing protein [Dactylosporangium sp. AC04546]WVK86086.1 DUF4132 domain-containing protein [Dactylosporangium sp. AC04546]
MSTEDTYVTPGSWQRSIVPRRGGLPVSWRPASGWAAVVAEHTQPGDPDSLSRRALTQQHTAADIREEGLAHLAGDPLSTPLGAAAVAVTVVGPSDRWSSAVSSAFADGWIATRGLPFAVRAAVELVDLKHPQPRGRVQTMGVGHVGRYGANTPSAGWEIDGTTFVLHRLRTAMAAAPDDEHAAAVAALAATRELPLRPHQLAVASFLAPERRDWVTHDVSAHGAVHGDWIQLLLVGAISEPGQFKALSQHGHLDYRVKSSLTRVHTLAEGLGVDGLPALLELADTYGTDAESRAVFGAIAAIPTDEAFGALLARVDDRYVAAALLEAADRFPRRAMRLLAAGPTVAAVNTYLRAHIAKHRDLVDEVAAALPAGPAERARAVAARLSAAREAPAEALPPLLASPPWAAGRKAAKPVVVAVPACADAPAVDWAPGEREAWSRRPVHYGNLRDLADIARRYEVGRTATWEEVGLFVRGSDEVVRALLPRWRPKDLWDANDWLSLLAARHELIALPMIADAARRSPLNGAKALLPFTGPEVAALMAEWFARLKSVRSVAAAWLQRHPEAAARALVPAALTKPGVARRSAERALRAIAAAGHRGAVEAAAQDHGAEAVAGIAALLDADPLEALPAKLPALPDWADPALLTAPELAGGAGSLPPDAVRHVLTMLAMSRIGEAYAGIAVLRETCDRASLAEFAWSLFEAWQLAGSPSKEGWVLDAQALLGDDGTVRRLAPIIRTWPGEGGHARAVTGLDVLAEIGTDVALMHLHGISEKVKFKGLKERAAEKIAEVAAGLRLTPEQLADRLVPDFGLEAGGTLVLDYGPRRFVVGFDEQLKPFVADEDGKRRAALPKPGAKDDPELAPAAERRFAGLKKDVRTVAGDQIRRFERAMVWQRRWAGAEFRELIVGHPLVWHVARRLVWATYDEAGAVVTALRVAEDRSLADLDDDTVTVADDAAVGVAHPLQLGANVPRWAELFADYEILQPFPQLGRETYTATEEELRSTELTRYSGMKVPTTKVIGLERRGWRRADPMDAGVQGSMERDLPGGAVLELDLEPGIVVGDVTMMPDQQLGGVHIRGADESAWRREHRHRFDGLDPVTLSEIIRDLREVVQ